MYFFVYGIISTLIFIIIRVHAATINSKISENMQRSEFKFEEDSEYDSSVSIPRSCFREIKYYSKACGLTSCMRYNTIVQGKSLDEGGCPSHLSFCSDTDVNPTADGTKIALVLEADKGQLGSGFIMVDQIRKVVTVVFRSSTTRQDWISDFTILPVDYAPVCDREYRKRIKLGEIQECKGCKMHRGFHVFTETLSRNFLEKIEGILESYPDFQIVATGHSLGAALAIMTGIELKLRGYDPLVITYASPRIFNFEMQQWVNDLFEIDNINDDIVEAGELSLDRGYIRIIHRDDYIPLMPPFYHTAGIEVVIEKRNLPHEIEDLSYHGIIEEMGSMLSSRTWGADYFDRMLHTYEHRSYFIDMGSCAGY